MMWRLTTYLTILLACFSLNTRAQNLVPNSGFEDVYDFTYGQNDVIENYVNSWFASCSEPDIYNFNSTNNQFIPPVNAGYPFYQLPHSGNSFIGLILYTSLQSYNNIRETIGVKLIDKLKPGFTYNYEYYINYWGNDISHSGGLECYPIKNIGIYIVKDSIEFVEKPYVPNVNSSTPDSFPSTNFYEPNYIISDTANWVKISGTFIAEGDEEYLYIGNFRPDSLTEFEDGFSNPIGYSYYYIDDILLIEDTTTGIEEKPINTIQIYPNPAQDYFVVDGGKLNNVQVELFDISGRRVLHQKVTTNQEAVDVSGLANGVYIAVVSSGRQVAKRQRLIIQN